MRWILNRMNGTGLIGKKVRIGPSLYFCNKRCSTWYEWLLVESLEMRKRLYCGAMEWKLHI